MRRGSYKLLFPALYILIVCLAGCAGTTGNLTQRQKHVFSSAKTVDLYYPADYVTENEKQKIDSIILESGREIVSEHKQDKYESTSAKKLILNGMKRHVDKKEQEKAIRHGKRYVPEDKQADMCIFLFSSLIRDITQVESLDAFHKQVNVCGKEYEGGMILWAQGVEPYESSGIYGFSSCSGTPPQLGLSLADRLQNVLHYDIVPFLSYKETVEKWPELEDGNCRIVVFYPRNKYSPAAKGSVKKGPYRYTLSDQFEFSNAWKIRFADGSFVFMDIDEGRHKMKYGDLVLDVQAQAGETVYIRIGDPSGVVKEEDAIEELELLHHGFKNSLPLNNQGR